jgi:hypothetical protein
MLRIKASIRRGHRLSDMRSIWISQLHLQQQYRNCSIQEFRQGPIFEANMANLLPRLLALEYIGWRELDLHLPT